MQRKLLSLAAACMLLGFNPEVNAEVTYDLQASGKDNAAALGNLKMKALRSQLQQLLTPEDMKKNAKLLRNEIFLKINEYAHTGDDISYTQQGKKVLAQGQVKVQDDKLAETLGKISLLKPQSSQLADSTTTAAKTETVQASSAPEESAQASSVPDKNGEVAATLPAPSSQDNSAPSQTDTTQASSTPEESAQVVATQPAQTAEESKAAPQTDTAQDSSTPEENAEVVATLPAPSSQESTAAPLTDTAQASSTPEESAQVVATLPAQTAEESKAAPQTDTAQDSSTPEESAQVVATLPAPSSQKQPEATQATSDSSPALTAAPETASEAQPKAPAPQSASFDPLTPEVKKQVTVTTTAEEDAQFIKLVLTSNSGAEIATALEGGANPNAKAPGTYNKVEYNNLPVLLHFLISKKNITQKQLEIVKALIEGGAEYNWISDDGSFSLAQYLFLESKKEPQRELLDYWLSLNPNLAKLKFTDRDGKWMESPAYIWLNRFASANPKKKEEYLNDPYYLKVYRTLYELGLNPNDGDDEHWESARMANYYTTFDFTRVPLEHGANPDKTCPSHALGDALIFFALKDNQLELVKLLKEQGANLNISPIKSSMFNSKRKPLEFYLTLDHKEVELKPEIVRLLIEGGATLDNLSLLYKDKSIPSDLFSYYLEQKPDLTGQNTLLRTFVQDYEEQENKSALFTTLLTLGAYPQTPEDQYELWSSCLKKGPPYVKALLESGHSATLKSRRDDPVLMELADNQDAALITLLTEYKTDFNVTDTKGKSLLYEACDASEPNADFIKALLDGGANPNLQYNDKTPLYVILSNDDSNHEEIVLALLSHGAEADKTYQYGRTALFPAVSEPKEPSPQVIEQLIKKGCPIDAQDQEGATALTFAVSAARLGAVQKLLELGADVKLALAAKTKIRVGKGKDAKLEEKTLKELLTHSEELFDDKQNERIKEVKAYLQKYL